MAANMEHKLGEFSVLYVLPCVNIPLCKLAISWWGKIGIHDVQLLLPSTLVKKQLGLPCKVWYAAQHTTLPTIASVMQAIENEKVLICTSCIIPLNLPYFLRCQPQHHQVVTFTRTMRKTPQSWIVDYNTIQSSIIMMPQSGEIVNYMKTHNARFGNDSLNAMLLDLRLKVLHAYQMPMEASHLVNKDRCGCPSEHWVPFNVMDLTGTTYNKFDVAHGYAYVFVDNHRHSCPKITKHNMELLGEASAR